MRLPVLLLLLVGMSAPSLSGQLIHVKFPDGDAAYLGLRTKQISNEKAQRLEFDYAEGAFVTSVLPDSPAEKAGLRAFDYIVKVDDKPVTDRYSLARILRDYEGDETLMLYYIREGEPMTRRVDLSRDRWSGETAIFVNEPVYVGLRQGSGFDRNGVTIRVQRNSPANEAGLRSGDEILRVGDYRVADFSDIQLAFRQYAPGDAVPVEYLRDGETRTDVVRPGDTEERLERLGERLENLVPTNIIVNGREEHRIDNGRGYDWNGRKNLEKSSPKEYGSGAYLGVFSRSTNSEKARKLGFENRYGRYVSKIVPDSPAEKAGVLPFDYITGVNGKAFSADYNFTHALGELEPGDKATFSLVRRKRDMTISTLLADRADFNDLPEQDECERPFLGVRQEHWTAPADELGVRVRILSNTSIAQTDLKSGTIIRRINDQPIVDWHDLSTAVRATPVGSRVDLDVTDEQGKTRRLNPVMKNYRSYKGGDCGDDEEWKNYDWEKRVYVNGEEITENAEEKILERSVSVADMRIKVEEMPTEEARALDMPTDNSLAVDDLTLAPNPSMGMFSVRFNLPERGDALIRIFNSAGREIYNYELTDFQGEFSDNVDISQNGPGLYFLAVNQNGKTLTRKLVLQRR